MRLIAVKWLTVLTCLLAVGCTSEAPAPRAEPSAPASSSAAPPSAAPHSATASPGTQERVLARVEVTREGRRLSFAALWTWGSGRSHRELVIGTGGDVRRIQAPHDGDVRAAFPVPEPSTALEASQVLPRLLTWEVSSLRPGTRAALGGGDGATLFPFERVAASEEYDDWSVQPLPRFGGATAYVSGAVLLRNGRLLVLLDHFSDDRAGRPSDRHHGLWVSRGSGLGRFAPTPARFTPGLTEPEDGWNPLVGLGASLSPDPVIYVSTWDQRVYVSTDGGLRFRELDVG